MGDAYTYNYRDISRYLNKEMTFEEMHAFEQAMMDDPFLADALEGYKKSDPAQTSDDLAFIEKKVKGMGDEEKALIIPQQNKTTWWRVAALVILVAGAAVIFVKVNNKEVDKTALAQEKPVLTGEIQRDTIRPLEKTPAAPELFREKQLLTHSEKSASPVISGNQGVQSPLSLAPRYDTARVTNERDHLYADNTAELKTSTADVASLARDQYKVNETAKTGNEFRGRVLDNNEKPLPYASVRADSNILAVTNNNGDFAIKASDSVLNVRVSSAGFASASRQIKSNTHDNKIVLNEADRSLDEVVVVGYGSAKKEKALVKKDDKSQTDNKSTDAEPEGGWQSFQDYVYGKLKKERDTSNTYISGDVLVEFNIDEKGKPRDVVVSRPVNKETADKAVQLIEKGPLWKSKTKNKKARVLIKF